MENIDHVLLLLILVGIISFTLSLFYKNLLKKYEQSLKERNLFLRALLKNTDNVLDDHQERHHEIALKDGTKIIVDMDDISSFSIIQKNSNR